MVRMGRSRYHLRRLRGRIQRSQRVLAVIAYTMLLSLLGAVWAYRAAYGFALVRDTDGFNEKFHAGAWRGTACAVVGFTLSAATLTNAATTASSLLAAILLTFALRARGTRRKQLHAAGYPVGAGAWIIFIATVMAPTLRAAA